MTDSNRPNDQFIHTFCNRLQTLIENSPFATPSSSTNGSESTARPNPLAGIQRMGADAKENLRALGEATLGQMNVVSRNEFDAQNAILAQTAEKLAQIEEKLIALEKILSESQKK